MKNSIGREIPEEIINGRALYGGEFALNEEVAKAAPKVKPVKPNESKLLNSIEEAIIKTGLKDGMTISFHHHFREGDYVLNMVVDAIAKLGIKNLTLASSSLSNVHRPLIEHIKNGVITKITTSGLRGGLAEEISNGLMEEPVIIRSHGGRARAIEAGDIKIDVAFLGASSSDEYGNASGSRGTANCGSLGYAKIDAEYADKVVIITDCLVDFPNMPASILQNNVDYVVKVDKIGNPSGIASGATRYTKNPKELLIAEYASKAIVESGYFKDGFSFQTGTGGASLAVSRFLRDEMIKKGIKASFALGGITKPMVEMYEEGLIKNIFDVQDFDLDAVASIGKNPRHYEIDSSFYTNPHNKGCIANKLDVVVLSALEVDTDFNVNVMTGSDGVLRGASGGHCDTAACAKLTIIVTPLVRGRIPCIVDSVNTVITPGESIDIVVTELGIAINPRRADLIERFKDVDIPAYTIEELRKKAESIVGIPDKIEYDDKVVAIVEYRDGSIIDVVRKVK
ncbi:MAG TPA: citrate lyase subunit alpha [Clostridiaceae bacterium]|jgi:citrate lyase subunit alpha/citrate CoA-transferase|nr:citrate lyase subunit alpha [Clostridiaceae bacterium]HBF77945.1 citrate lyase subunit alpha [Clostridiaceae bacterium]HBG38305.1 citrate lyase subunit alpha [Clostridiaceae bacterium]HBN28013.1 citrate lyase subunit alpha [Clostridiaceae bacterium]HCL49759.1 citrate lyase subunit alpha [Clostridiaceae bacterium]